MNVTRRNHYNPCFWTAIWSAGYFTQCAIGKAEKSTARQQVVHALSVKSQQIYATTVERVHYDKNLGIAEITRETAEDFVRRYHPDQLESFLANSRAADYPVFLDFESILTGIESLPPYEALLKAAISGNIDNLIEKANIASFVILQNLRSHALMNALLDWNEELGYPKFEYFLTLKWMLSDTSFLLRLVYPLVCAHWVLYTCPEHTLPLCDSPVLVQPNSIMVALSPRLLLEISSIGQIEGGEMPLSVRISDEKVTEYQRRTIGNTFREIIGEKSTLEKWRRTELFIARTNLLSDVKKYNALVRAEGSRELWHINAYGNHM